MIKKYFALTIIAASVSLAACSDDDDDDDGDNMEMPGTPDPNPMPPASPEATPGVGGTAYDTIVNSDDLQSLEDAIIAAGLADVLDDPASQFTIFAPTNDAIAAAQAALGDDFPADEALHVYFNTMLFPGTVTAEQASTLVTGSTEPVLVDTILVDLPGTDDATTQQIALTAGGTAGILINETTEVTMVDVSVLGAEEAAETPTIGTVHTIGAVLLPPAAPEPTVVEPTPDPGPVAGTSGTADAALAAAGTSEIFRAAVVRDFGPGAVLDGANAWTYFIPTDAALTAAGLTDLTVDQQRAHIVASGAIDETTLGGAANVTASDNTVYPVTNTGGVITVGGATATFVATGDGGAQIYSIDAVLGN